MFKTLPRQLLLTFLCSATACEGALPIEEGDVESSQAALSIPDLPTFEPGRKIVASPFQGLVGRGINRRVPLTRLDFTPGVLGGEGVGWNMPGDERGLCVSFANGVTVPTAVGFQSNLRATVVQGEESFKAAVNLRGNIAADANIVFPLDGIPIPVGGSVDDEIALRGALESSSNTVTASIYATASFAAVKGNGAASIRKPIIDAITTLPADQRARAFFAKCGDSFLDEVRLGGYFAIDISIQANKAKAVIDARAKLRRELNLLDIGGDGATTGGAGVLDGVLGLLGEFNLGANQELDANLRIEKVAGDEKLVIQVRHGGPPLPAGLTVKGALDLARDWSNYVKDHKSDLTPMDGKLKLFATTDNAEALGITLPVYAVDNSYNQRMSDYNAAILRHLPKRNYFESAFDLLTGTNQSAADLFFPSTSGALPTALLVADKADTAREIVIGILKAQQCLMELPPGAPSAHELACKYQRVDLPGGAEVVNVVKTDLGDYPFFPRAGEVNIGRTWDDFGKLVAAAGYAITLRSSQDDSDKACILTQDQDKLVFFSGETDDLNPFTGSLCRWDLWNVPLRAGWKVKLAEWQRYGDPDHTSHPANDSISGSVAANHKFGDKGGVILRTLSFRGPLSATDFDYESHPRQIDFVIDP